MLRAALLLGVCIDLFLRDSRVLPHPVVLLGRLASCGERILRRIFPATENGERAAGCVVVCAVCAAAYGIPAYVLSLVSDISQAASFILQAFWAFQIPAVRGLCSACLCVYRALESGSLQDARAAVSHIVGRDTAQLDRAAVIRAAVETAAENTCDAIVAPLLFLCVGGVPLGMCYKAVNTLDSMFGYKNERYRSFGWAAARLDDICNLIPSRLAALLLLAVSPLAGLDTKNGWRVFRRDRFRHASPNAGQTEAAAAGLLGIRLAGPSRYEGVMEDKPWIGDALRAACAHDIVRMVRLIYMAAVFCIGILFCLPVLCGVYAQ